MTTSHPREERGQAGEGFSFQQPQRNRMHDVLLRLGHAAIQSQKITDHEAANAAQRQCLGEIEALVSQALAAASPAAPVTGTEKLAADTADETVDPRILAMAKAMAVGRALDWRKMRYGACVPQQHSRSYWVLLAQDAAAAKLKPCPWEEEHLCCYPKCNCAPGREPDPPTPCDLVPASLPAALGRGEGTAGASPAGSELPSKAHAPADHGPTGGYLSRGALERAVRAMESATVFVTSRERINRPTGEDWWQNEIALARAALIAGGLDDR